jgi:glycosyltransferase involved in cell wall biosynthesis
VSDKATTYSPERAWERVSVIIPTLNEERNLPACLASVQPCGEVIVVDSGSNDGTRALVQQKGGVWLEKAWEGFAAARRAGEAVATREFVLFMDADERVSPELRREIAERIHSGEAAKEYLHIRRVSRFLGRKILRGDWSNDWVSRFAPRGCCTWEGLEPHPYLRVENLPRRRCAGVLEHEPYRDIDVFSKKIESYARTWAAESEGRGVRLSRWRLLVAGAARAGWRFGRGLVLKRGLLDGRPGLVIAQQNARMVWLKYYFLAQRLHGGGA